jgi:hypothetical protein
MVDYCHRGLCPVCRSIQDLFFSGVVIFTYLRRKLDELKIILIGMSLIYQLICLWPCMRERTALEGKLLSAFEILFQTIFTIY